MSVPTLHTSECIMWVRWISTTWKAVAVLLACVLLVVATGCLVHADTQAHTHTTDASHQHPASSHLTPDLHCLIAVLPVMLTLVSSALGVFYTLPLLSHPVSLIALPFKPPKDVIYA